MKPEDQDRLELEFMMRRSRDGRRLAVRLLDLLPSDDAYVIANRDRWAAEVFRLLRVQAADRRDRRCLRFETVFAATLENAGIDTRTGVPMTHVFRTLGAIDASIGFAEVSDRLRRGLLAHV